MEKAKNRHPSGDKLSSLGVTGQQSSRWQRAAVVPGKQNARHGINRAGVVMDQLVRSGSASNHRRQPETSFRCVTEGDCEHEEGNHFSPFFRGGICPRRMRAPPSGVIVMRDFGNPLEKSRRSGNSSSMRFPERMIERRFMLPPPTLPSAAVRAGSAIECSRCGSGQARLLGCLRNPPYGAASKT